MDICTPCFLPFVRPSSGVVIVVDAFFFLFAMTVQRHENVETTKVQRWGRITIERGHVMRSVTDPPLG
jgi:hypothetical protein